MVVDPDEERVAVVAVILLPPKFLGERCTGLFGSDDRHGIAALVENSCSCFAGANVEFAGFLEKLVLSFARDGG